jgi:type II secretory pathway pseudopilin PulG
MSPTQIILVVLIVAVVVAAVVALVLVQRRRALREKFGEEYERLVDEFQSTSAADKELRERERRHAELELRELTPEARERYIQEWQEVQAQFVDAPAESVVAADAVVTKVLDDIGYPTGEFDDQAAHVSVDHARTLSAYRRAHEITERSKRHETTEDELRQAVLDYRELVTELLGETPVPQVETSVAPTQETHESPTPRDTTRH